MKPLYSGRRGYRIVYLHCYRCGTERPFYRINSWPYHTKKEAPANVSHDARLINATCMICGKTSNYILSVRILKHSRYAMGDLCSCGLPACHSDKHLEELRAEAAATL